ncbi:MAG: SDR family oxidoreductase [Candidatus Sericytochromatia bacterium]|nr:SDR family oxidoreductase [Candidatus Sericytochromatia bacterium]
MMQPMTDISSEELATCSRLLEALAGDLTLLAKFPQAERIRLLMAAGQVIHPEKADVIKRRRAGRKENKETKRSLDRSLRAATTIRSLRTDSVFVPPPRLLLSAEEEDIGADLLHPRACYVCKGAYRKVHAFYDSMCPPCARFNYDKRFQTARLDGRVVLITGARLKIGYQAALILLRAGAQVIVTTRFPQDSALRYIGEADFPQWSDRLQIHGLDLRHSPSVELFTGFIDRNYDRLDFLINNAAQTVRRPPGFYRHLLEIEERPYLDLPIEAQTLLRNHEAFKTLLRRDAGADTDDGTTWVSEWHQGKLLAAPGVTSSAQLSQVPYACDDAAQDPSLFPVGQLDVDSQQVDLRRMNSWRMTLADVPTAELLEVQLVNAIAPFILCSKLKPLMLRTPTTDKHIVNVSAMEGQFGRHTKTDKHPHTNMAKAALNMMTLTSARDFARDGIYMNAVDTGWITDEDPAEISVRKQEEHDFQPPLDVVDGAARVVDPIFSGMLSGQHTWGKFLKDYVPTAW